MTTSKRRASLRAALACAFPTATWKVYRQDIRGVFGALTITLAVADIYSQGVSEIVVYPTRKSQTWDSLARMIPKSGSSRAVIATVRRALREVEKMQAPVHAAVELLEGRRR